jgi:hypothetical protein
VLARREVFARQGARPSSAVIAVAGHASAQPRPTLSWSPPGPVIGASYRSLATPPRSRNANAYRLRSDLVMKTLVDAIRTGAVDAELGALIWLLAESGVPVHVASPDGEAATHLAAALGPVARDQASVSAGSAEALEDVLRQPVPLRPATGAVLIMADGRVTAAHFQRPPLRDGAGHIRPQGPAVLATWDPRTAEWEHFAWGVTPELATAAGRRAGDFEIEVGRRREYLEALVASGVDDDAAAGAALAGYRVDDRRQ